MFLTVILQCKTKLRRVFPGHVEAVENHFFASVLEQSGRQENAAGKTVKLFA